MDPFFLVFFFFFAVVQCIHQPTREGESAASSVDISILWKNVLKVNIDFGINNSKIIWYFVTTQQLRTTVWFPKSTDRLGLLGAGGRKRCLLMHLKGTNLKIISMTVFTRATKRFEAVWMCVMIPIVHGFGVFFLTQTFTDPFALPYLGREPGLT